MTPSPAYLAGRVTGFLVRPLLPVAEAALGGVLDGLFGEPDELDASYTPIADPEPYVPVPYVAARDYDEACDCADCRWHRNPVWTLERDRIDQIAGTA